jgi:hypothetical protein
MSLRPALVLRIAVVLGLVAVAGTVGYLIGNRGHRSVSTRTGIAYASPSEASIVTSGWTYGFVPLDVPWIDSQGTIHEGTRPSCLPSSRRSRIVFGTVDVPAIGQRSVVWVRCGQP